MKTVKALALLLLVTFLPFAALAQESAPAEIVISDPTGGFLAAIPGGIYLYGLVVMAAGLVSVFVKDSAMPALLARVVNFLAMNGRHAKNDPAAN